MWSVWKTVAYYTILFVSETVCLAYAGCIQCYGLQTITILTFTTTLMNTMITILISVIFIITLTSLTLVSSLTSLTTPILLYCR